MMSKDRYGYDRWGDLYNDRRPGRGLGLHRLPSIRWGSKRNGMPPHDNPFIDLLLILTVLTFFFVCSVPCLILLHLLRMFFRL